MVLPHGVEPGTNTLLVYCVSPHLHRQYNRNFNQTIRSTHSRTLPNLERIKNGYNQKTFRQAAKRSQLKGYPARTQSFSIKFDARLWSNNHELELHREENGLKKNMYLIFRECLERYRGEIFIHKRSKKMETKLIIYKLWIISCHARKN